MTFCNEKDFEDALVAMLPAVGWEDSVLENYDETRLLQNWANILFENNRDIDRLNDFPLTGGEMQQILEQVKELKTPLRLNGFINGGSVQITRDNPEDTLHFGKEISLKIYNRKEIAAGQSRYQIARQPRFSAKSKILNDRRGDVLLLINGMPVIHVELKRSGVPVSQACNQIQKYAAEGCFTGLFSLVQVFVAMNPEEALYFANPGPEGKFNPDYYFHWADFHNEPINMWNKFTRDLLSIPMAHQLIGFYTVADDSDGILKVMRSYQYQAANAISDKVSKARWEAEHLGANQRGGFVWHTTGSGKTMTSFKSAQLIASSRDADKVVFLMDRIELGTQSLREYRSLAEENEAVQATENTSVLAGKLKGNDPSDTLIVTSLQKMSNIRNEGEYGLNAADLEKMRSKRIVFIVDECHRSTFGDMLLVIRETFPLAMFFGFTGTPIHEENQKKKSTTATVFGNELHRYSIADGIRDKNVLGFDPYKVATYRDQDVRKAVALERAKASDEDEVHSDSKKKKIFNKYMRMPMAGHTDATGKYCKGIEDCIPHTQYQTPEHQNKVVEDILENWSTLSHGSKFHAIFATSSIPEAMEYYRLFRSANTKLKITALFDPNIDNDHAAKALDKEAGLKEIVEDYNAHYGQHFSIPTFAAMKKDIASRLAHKKPYERIEREPEKQLNLLIVVDQMLTGFDSKWVNTLYLDKLLQYENIIQAFSRTNRLFAQDEKPFGTIKYYRYPHTMEKNIEAAVALYSGNRPLALFVQKLPENIEGMNRLFAQIFDLFNSAKIENFSKLPDDASERNRFVKLFNEFNGYFSAAKVQGFSWNKICYEFVDRETNRPESITVTIDEYTYNTLARRYQELHSDITDEDSVPYDLVGYITTIDTDKIDSDYMNSRFVKYIKTSRQENISEEEKQQARNELHKTFASLSQKEQKVANILLHEMQREDFVYEEGKTFRDYIADYLSRKHDARIHALATVLGLDEKMLHNMMELHLTTQNINEFGRYDTLKSTMDKQKARLYFESLEEKRLPPPKVLVKADNLLREFIISGGLDIQIKK
ncbi:HsdR family type I site-specific deoxyribonuclease [uncultured Desulfovibrio sp.]|uniref:type I restriction endonuclease subunit R n=1 Tax=uncultured Desulfovibrio sp. TaxID=167968 RepID=UPI0026315351|nr:HsdR family type I site-specific deoxyribonuclease [uncultured Desulfovibrio sp.]